MLGTTWNVTPAERAARLPCDELMPDAVRLDRAISIAAPTAMVFAWLCQLRIAPYSYDLLDNTGRRSPRTRCAALTDLAVGQPFVRIFGAEIAKIPEHCGYDSGCSIRRGSDHASAGSGHGRR